MELLWNIYTYFGLNIGNFVKRKKTSDFSEVLNSLVFRGGAYRGRTDDLLHAMQAL